MESELLTAAELDAKLHKTAAALVGVVAQRLVRTICQRCKTPYFPPEEILEMVRYQGDRRRQFLRGEGCRECYDTGFRGRTGIYEVLWSSRELRHAMLENMNLAPLRQCHIDQGGTLLIDEGVRLAEEGKTSLEEVIRVAFTD